MNYVNEIWVRSTFPGISGAPDVGATPEVRSLYIENPNSPNSRILADRWVVRNDFLPVERSPDPREKSHVDRYYTILDPWSQCGVKMFWMDAGAVTSCEDPTQTTKDRDRRRWGVHELAYAPFLISRNIRIGGEAYPTYDSDGLQLNKCELRQIPYLALDSWLFSQNDINPNTWRFDTSFSRYCVPPNSSTPDIEPHWFAASTVSTFSRLGEVRNRGYVVTGFMNLYTWGATPIYDISAMRVIQRWYSMGRIQIADFNGDGIVGIAANGAGTIEGDDWYAFHHYWNMYNDLVTGGPSGRGFTVFAIMGDICGATVGSPPDGIIDDIDRL
jgi:hypothetical protein